MYAPIDHNYIINDDNVEHMTNVQKKSKSSPTYLSDRLKSLLTINTSTKPTDIKKLNTLAIIKDLNIVLQEIMYLVACLESSIKTQLNSNFTISSNFPTFYMDESNRYLQTIKSKNPNNIKYLNTQLKRIDLDMAILGIIGLFSYLENTIRNIIDPNYKTFTVSPSFFYDSYSNLVNMNSSTITPDEDKDKYYYASLTNKELNIVHQEIIYLLYKIEISIKNNINSKFILTLL